MYIVNKIDNLLSEVNAKTDKTDWLAAQYAGIKKYGKFQLRDGQSAIDGMSKQKAKTMIYKAIKPHYHNRMYKDAYWEGPHNVFKEFEKMNLNWVMEKVEYQSERGVNIRKEWRFKILFDNDRNKQNELYGHLTASGAGSMEDPLEKYDLIFVVS
jgi:DNA-binding transcriptional regulator WhiA